jgi:ribosome biogenesis GTPase / thiamine phosphate phosphatase
LRTSDLTGPLGAPGNAEPNEPLVDLGWDEELATAFAGVARPGDRPARVSAAHRGGVSVVTSTGPAEASLGEHLAEAPTTGDWVVLRPVPGNGLVAAAVLPRRTVIVRRDPNSYTVLDQVLAANVDVVAVVHGLDRPLKLTRIERSLVVGWESGAVPVVVLAKADLSPMAEFEARAAEGAAPGVEVVLTSAETGLGVEALHAAIGPGRTAVFLGPSGAGKSSLVNRLVGEEVQDTGGVRDGDHKGRHTTTTRELIVLPGGGLLIDSPGLRALGLWEADEGLERTFPEIESLASACRFRDCSHGPEPGCAVRDAIERGELPERRLLSYRKLQRELEFLSGEKAEHERRIEARKFAKRIRHHKHKRPR